MSEKKEKPLNIYEKLIEVRKSVQYLQKETSGRFSYARESSVLTAIRPKMDELGILLTIDMYEVSTVDKMVTASFRFTFINAEKPEEQVVSHFHLQDASGSPQKLGGLATYATRYGLTRAFLIPQDELDPDKFMEKTGKKEMLTQAQVDHIQKLCSGREDLLNIVVSRAPDGDLFNIGADRYPNIVGYLTEERKKELQNETN